MEIGKAGGMNEVEYLTHIVMNAASIGNGEIEGWRTSLPCHWSLADAREYIAGLASAAPDAERTEPYVLRGKKNK